MNTYIAREQIGRCRGWERGVKLDTFRSRALWQASRGWYRGVYSFAEAFTAWRYWITKAPAAKHVRDNRQPSN